MAKYILLVTGQIYETIYFRYFNSSFQENMSAQSLLHLHMFVNFKKTDFYTKENNKIL